MRFSHWKWFWREGKQLPASCFSSRLQTAWTRHAGNTSPPLKHWPSFKLVSPEVWTRNQWEKKMIWDHRGTAGSFSKCFIVSQEWTRLTRVSSCLPGRISSSRTQRFCLSRVWSALTHRFLPVSLPLFRRWWDGTVRKADLRISSRLTEECSWWSTPTSF